jgi:ATP-dependent DNA helicase RecQ
VRPASGEWDDVFATFDADRADFLRRVLASGKEGRIWTGIDPKAVPGEERDRVVSALDYLEQQGLVELKVADVRQRFTLLQQPPSRDELRDRLAERFDRREQSEAERIERVVALVEHEGCQVQSLVGYFGETRPEPCGHCTFCLTGTAQRLPKLDGPPGLELDRAALDELTAEHPTALGTPRQRARFLCGLSSPATTKAKLSRHSLFGVMAEQRFADVLART